MAFKDRLRTAMDAEKVSNTMLASDIGVSIQAVGKWLSTGLISKKNIKLVAKRLNTTIDWLMGEDDTSSNKIPAYKIVTYSEADDLDSEKYVSIPLLDMNLAAGNGDVVPDYVETKRRLAFSREWMDSKGHKPDNMRIMAVRGQSMEPMLNEGDIVLVDTSNRHIVDGKVYALMFGQEARIKRLKLKYDGSVVIMSDNPAPEYADESVPTSEQESLHIIGRAVHRSGDI